MCLPRRRGGHLVEAQRGLPCAPDQKARPRSACRARQPHGLLCDGVALPAGRTTRWGGPSGAVRVVPALCTRREPLRNYPLHDDVGILRSRPWGCLPGPVAPNRSEQTVPPISAVERSGRRTSACCSRVRSRARCCRCGPAAQPPCCQISPGIPCSPWPRVPRPCRGGRRRLPVAMKARYLLMASLPTSVCGARRNTPCLSWPAQSCGRPRARVLCPAPVQCEV